MKGRVGSQTQAAKEPDRPRPHSAERESRVSVVIPCFNDGATLQLAVASVRQQEPCELVVVDDGSADPGTITTLRELERAGTTVLRQANQGPAAARRAGLAATSARYVFALDADDLLEPRAITRLAEALDADPGAALAWGDVQTFGDVTVRQRGPRTLDPWLTTYLDELTGASTLVRRTRLEEAGWQSTDGFENWDMWMRFCERGWRGVYVPGTVLHYRLHGDGSRRSAKDRQRYAQLYATLQARHAALFARRPTLWHQSAAPLRLKLSLPLIARLGLDEEDKQRLGNVINHPLRPLAVRRSRLQRVLRG